MRYNTPNFHDDDDFELEQLESESAIIEGTTQVIDPITLERSRDQFMNIVQKIAEFTVENNLET